ncbi:MAG: L-seryl-tRNA(Sec) selenium transferase [Anaerolineaceae bacterium]|nr:L-seryl-tRNA(Sec) selenium transferase [Anaerolineaceae bacterium]
MAELRDIPSVDHLLQTPQAAGLVSSYGRSLTLQALREALYGVRDAYRRGANRMSSEDILHRAEIALQSWVAPSLEPVINATGVILHTNLGRAPLSAGAMLAVGEVGGAYCNLEYDLDRGARGVRSSHVEGLLTRLSGAEAAFVVTNNAGAVLLALSALARRRRVVISRTQLIEIGGGFRVPDVMAQSGARLVEIGATNRVHLADYAAALQEPAALVMRAHHSNFQIVGFSSETTLVDIAGLAHQAGAAVLDDLGSGALLDTAQFGLAHEPTVQESIAAGADLVCFSGDKLLGGPQAGILVGRKPLIERMKKHPLARALRADKLCLAALAATLEHYLRGTAERSIPVWQMIAASPAVLRDRAVAWQVGIQAGEVLPARSTVGGGSLPGETLPTFVLSLRTPRPDALVRRLRHHRPAIIARIEAESVLLDPRTVLAGQDEALVAGVSGCLGASR